MSKEEIVHELFILDMKDHFTNRDLERKDELEKMLKEMSNEQD
jgi:hypothetical protein